MNEIVIRQYVNRAKKAISGKNGHTTTLKVACMLHNGFGLCGDDLVRWLGVYNARLSDQWTDGELEHKAEAAENFNYDKPRGWMLDSAQVATPARFAIRPANNCASPPPPRKSYVLTPDTTDVFYSNSFIRARTRAQGGGEPEISVVSVQPAVVLSPVEAMEVPDVAREQKQPSDQGTIQEVAVAFGRKWRGGLASDPLILAALEVFKSGVGNESKMLQGPPAPATVALAMAGNLALQQRQSFRSAFAAQREALRRIWETKGGTLLGGRGFHVTPGVAGARHCQSATGECKVSCAVA